MQKQSISLNLVGPINGVITNHEINHLYPMDFKMHRDGKGANPREHSKLCDRSECSQQRGNLKDDGYN
ncbi:MULTISPECIES: hypothetical protein [Photorhabdus]|uniref:Uncharacterized protein n=2 Tax=Photorhabdus TaxID=29487 RepID=A0ABX0B709_9GAMM|nr:MULTISPECIES: hypothetical protein [Photorhabdus]MCC8375616.1 hypothetical protein [Photorhabdus bodei]MCC8464564.1 hypothetical protein [Photorhabdus bodei]MDB6369825.1 hypothetical protein [Photorhabdus bodei]MDB6372154.1 hypothetical protein [Photorhabdus bodei]NDL14042.1 hypothetical protein [Photorhabdus kayaii]